MTFRSRRLLDIAHEAPCMLRLGVPGCGAFASVPCHSDMLRPGRGMSSKSGDQFAVAGCPACHEVFTRRNLGREGYDEAWRQADERYRTWLWESGKIAVK